MPTYIPPPGVVPTGSISTAEIEDGAVTAAKVAADVATQAELDAVQKTVTLNAQTVNYTLVLTDAGKAVEMAHASDRTITVPPNTDVAFPVGTVVEVARMGAGAVALVAGAGVTIRSAGGLLGISAQYAGATLRQRAANEWVLNGSLA